MNNQDEKIVECSEFEELLSDYLDGSLERDTHKAVATHALRCPLCHALLNQVKEALEVCHEISAPKTSMTHLEARILSMTMPETAMQCEEFEEFLTDYLDGFLPANLFHRWERHAVLCENCTDLPGAVVRSIAACYTYKMDELPIPAGMNERILQATIGAEKSKTASDSWISQVSEWMRELRFPLPVPQIASVALMMMFAAFIFSQTVSADGSISGMYQKSFELAGQTYKEGADIFLGEPSRGQQSNREPVQGTFVNQEENK